MTFKVMTIVGTRPEIIKLSQVIQELDRHVIHIFVHTGQNYDYELNEIFFQELGIRIPDHFLNVVGKNTAYTIGNVIARTDDLLAKECPDAFLLLGDTNSCLSAIAAKRRKVPIFHMEAGNRCFDQRVPEEINRKIIDHLSDINLTYTEHARCYLLSEGLRPEMVIKIGSPMKEVLDYYRPQIEASDILERLQLEQDRYFVVSAHREENIDDPAQFKNLVASLNAIADQYGLPVIISTHPRTRNRFEKLSQSPINNQQLLNFMKPLSFFDYVHLQTKARATLSDSGTISEESSILNFPALNIRNAHERPEAMEEASVMLTGLEPERVLQGLEILRTQPRGEERILSEVSDYAMSNISDKVLRIIVSYTDYVKRYVWHEDGSCR